MFAYLTYIVSSFLVFLPAPIVYGKLFDSTCIIWKETCGSKGACQLYDIENMRFTLKSADSLLAAISFLVTIPALIYAQKEGEKGSKKDINLEEIESGNGKTKNGALNPEK
jgi:hypothetical protein